ncbi:MAG: PEP-CTERM sorting domain-containing protein [Planctomycetota bacterium]
MLRSLLSFAAIIAYPATSQGRLILSNALVRLRVFGMQRVISKVVCFVSTVALLSLTCGDTKAGVIFWDPADIETSGATLFELETGRSFLNIDPSVSQLEKEAAEFEVSGFQGPTGANPLIFTNVGVVLRDSTSFNGFNPSNPPAFFGSGLAVTNTSNFSTVLTRFSPGETIDGNSLFQGDGVAYNSRDSITPYQWAPSTRGFVGLQLTINNRSHYGWAELILGPELGNQTLTSFAYESIPNTPIIAGAQTGNAVVPEPASLAIFGIGTLGMVGMGRRRIKKHAA